MGMWILEDKVLDRVPGTTRYFDDPERPQYAADGVHGLKCDTSGPVPIILVPQPSDDPNDPLNWSLLKRDAITLTLSLTAIFATALGPILAANTITLTFWYVTSFSRVAQLTGYYLLGVGIGGIIFVPSGRIWGKRHLFLGGTVLLIVSSAWAGGSGKNYLSMVFARIVQGIATAPFEAFVNAAMGDLYFVHERGIRMAFTNLAVFGGAFFTPILVGKITSTIMWWWTFYLVAIFCAACLPAVYFLCPETAFRRDSSLNLDMVDDRTKATHVAPVVTNGNEDDPEKLAGDGSPSTSQEGNSVAVPTPPNRPPTAPKSVPVKASWRQSLALFNGRKTDESFWKLLLRPFPLFLQPAFFWACLIQGLLIGWTVFIGVMLAEFFLSTPYWWDEVQTGYAYTAPFVGAILGFVIAGSLSDWTAKFMTKRNGGIYEPEFRLLLVIPQMIFGCAGLYGWGITVDGIVTRRYTYIPPLIFFALEVAGMVIGAVASSLYIVDAYRDLAIEGFTCMIIFKNIFSFALTFKAYDWFIENRTKATPVFNALGSVQLVVSLAAIPMCKPPCIAMSILAGAHLH
ncbi:major facilitator superfamily domain-containing protein [Lasiosphaeria miniovina]|uniref:Major facilitator superfamily domain-containing protein n=1 Tax=Lasiosphaeria miniovina TaxID=1954250 RepID=A0AA40AL83_9PEZI|nr:major facilitator superfamily domain-containing protein [Lasiosphaeria miniovina]KAK0717902.1 major facilitator superfamily domain-containing protein [Lasiosphaeria miniovina]